jgi:tRNA A37 threonylcarbamoyladenosine modification protein TsaB
MSDLAPRTSDPGPRMSDLGPRISGLAPGTSALGVWIDAHRREVFGALYAADGATIEPPTALSPDATLDAWMRTIETGARVRFAGDGAVRYAGIIRARLGERADLPAGVPPLAGAAGRIAAAEPARGVVPHAIVPLYVRRSDAELARDRARVDRQRAPVPQGEDPRP